MPPRRNRSAEPISRRSIQDAAVAIVRESGYDAVSMRAIASRLHTGPASLYAHIAGKDDIDALLMEHVFAQLTPLTDDDWGTQLLGAYTQIRSLLADHRGLGRAYIAASPSDPRAMHRLERLSATMAAAGIGPRERLMISHALDEVTVGEAVSVEVMDARVAASGLDYRAYVDRSLDAALAALGDDLPNLSEEIRYTRAHAIRFRDFMPEIMESLIAGFTEQVVARRPVIEPPEADLAHLQAAVDAAEQALSAGEDPCGAVLVAADGAILRTDHHRTRETGDPLAHAEASLTRWALEHLDADARAASVVFCSTEPCPMCAAAHGWAGLGRLVFAASSSDVRSWAISAGRPAPPVDDVPASRVLPAFVVQGPVPAAAERVRGLVERWAQDAGAGRARSRRGPGSGPRS